MFSEGGVRLVLYKQAARRESSRSVFVAVRGARDGQSIYEAAFHHMGKRYLQVMEGRSRSLFVYLSKSEGFVCVARLVRELVAVRSYASCLSISGGTRRELSADYTRSQRGVESIGW